MENENSRILNGVECCEEEVVHADKVQMVSDQMPPEDRLYDLLKCHSGAASPLGLIFDADRSVALLIDSALRDAPRLAFHPCDNTLTLAMSGEDFFGKYLPAVQAAPVYVEIHDFL